MQFKSLIYFLSIVAVVVAQTPQDAFKKFAILQEKVIALDKAINAFPNSGGTVKQALAIHNDARDMGTAADATTNATVAIPTPISEADGRTAINDAKALLPTVKDALSVIVKKKPVVEALPLKGAATLVKQDLQALQTSMSKLEDALLKRAPSDLLSEANSLADELNAAFATATKAYADA